MQSICSTLFTNTTATQLTGNNGKISITKANTHEKTQILPDPKTKLLDFSCQNDAKETAVH